MQFRKFLAAICIIAVGLASSASAVSLPVGGLKIDVQATSGQPSLPAWEKWNTGLPTDDGGSATALIVSGITFAMSGDVLCVRTGSGDNVTYEAAFSDTNGAGNKLRVTVTGLNDGTYTMKTYHNWILNNQQYVDIFSNTTQVADEFPTSYNKALGTAASKEFDFTISGGTGYFDVIAGSTIGSTGEYKTMLNGFVLTPEPATIALLGMGSLVLMRRRRR